MTERSVFLIPFLALQAACAAPASLRTVPETRPPIETAAPVPSSEPPANAPDDVEIEQRIEDESAPLRQVRDAQARAEEAAAPVTDREERIPELPEIEHGLRGLQAKYDIPIDVNEAVVRYIRFFQSPEVRPHFVRWLSRSRRYAPRFREILREERLPEDTVYLAMVESGFANLATSRAKAVGAWQFIASTGERFGLRQDFWVDERRDPEKAARAAARFLMELYRQHGDWRLAWAAYNAGPGRISRARKLGYSGFWEMARARRVLPAETRAYVPKIMAAAIIAKHAEAFGFEDGELEPERWVDYHEVVVPRTTELSFVAEAARVDVDVLLDLNPELRRTCTPPRPYPVKIPRDNAQVFAGSWSRIAERAARTAVARHQVRRGETLAAIARAYGVQPAVVTTLNKLRSWRVREGTVLVIPLGSVPRREAEAVARRSVPAKGKVRVRPGDSLWSLARRHGVTVRELARWNGIRDPERDAVRAGRILAVTPRAAAPAVRIGRAPSADHAKRRPTAVASSARKVRVQPGDSLWSLARRFGVTIRDLAEWNGIRRPHRHTLHAGRTLVVRQRHGS
jgi:membrane-bound lytic murein transglycosylase D